MGRVQTAAHMVSKCDGAHADAGRTRGLRAARVASRPPADAQRRCCLLASRRKSLFSDCLSSASSEKSGKVRPDKSMIPEQNDSWLCAAPQAQPAASPTAAASGGVDQLLPRPTAWIRYRYLLKAMEARGEKVDRQSLLEAMFRGGNLVYARAISEEPAVS